MQFQSLQIENLKRQYETNLLIPVYHKIGRSTVHKRKESSKIREKINRIEDVNELEACLEEYFKSL